MNERYAITIEKQPWIKFWQTLGSTPLQFVSYFPESGDVWNTVEEDIVITYVFNPGTREDETVRILREYSAWLNTRD